jgi:hypothetical protein
MSHAEKIEQGKISSITALALQMAGKTRPTIEEYSLFLEATKKVLSENRQQDQQSVYATSVLKNLGIPQVGLAGQGRW